MPLFGKPQLGQPRKPFDLAEQNGEQVDSVRSKIASLMDGVTEKRAAPQPEATEETVQRQSQPQPQSAPESNSSRGVGGTLPAELIADGGIQSIGDGAISREPNRNRWPWQDGEAEQATLPASHVPAEQRPTPLINGNNGASVDVTSADHIVDSVHMDNRENDDSEPAQWPRRAINRAEIHKPERSIPKEVDDVSSQPPERSWSLPPLFAQERPRTYTDPTTTDPTATDATTSQPTAAANGQPHIGADTGVGKPFAAADSSVAASSGQLPATSAINIKGRAGGILVEIGKGHWPDLMVVLAERLAGAGNFFRNGAVALDLAARPLSEIELRQVHEMFTEQTLELVLVRTASPETFQVALDMGLSAQLETLEGQTTTSAQPALANLADEHHFVYAGHLRAGQVLQRREHILIIGDVNPGATVISDGDILVWGHLRGMAQAGASGDAKAVVAALNLVPVQLRIGDFIAIAPEAKNKRSWGRQRSPAKQPEVAYLNQDRIVVEPWDATKFGGIAALR